MLSRNLSPEDKIRIEHMIEAAADIVDFISGKSRDDLDRERMLYLAVVRSIEVIGEAASKVSAETRQVSPQIPWRVIIAMRSRIVHAYHDINRSTVWRTAVEEVPKLLSELRALIRES
jgi:uncharacterized protein with HEPN domain